MKLLKELKVHTPSALMRHIWAVDNSSLSDSDLWIDDIFNSIKELVAKCPGRFEESDFPDCIFNAYTFCNIAFSYDDDGKMYPIDYFADDDDEEDDNFGAPYGMHWDSEGDLQWDE